MVVWNFNLHRSIVMKMRVRDAGDASALAAARWQGISMNMVGDLNLIQAALVSDALAQGLPTEDDDGNVYVSDEVALAEVIGVELEQLNQVRRRVAVNGPLIGFAAAQQMAFNNKIHANSSFQNSYDYLTYDSNTDTNSIAAEYFDLLDSVTGNGVAAKTITTHDGHILYDAGFYNAIWDAKVYGNWCAFYLNSEYRFWLESYTSYSDWPELPDIGFSILDLDVRQARGSLNAIFNGQSNSVPTVSEFQGAIDEFAGDIDAGAVANIYLNWVIFGSTWSASWQEFADYNELPFRNEILPQYDYMGPESVFEVSIGYDVTGAGAEQLTGRNAEGVVTNFFDFERNKAKAGDERKRRKMRWVSAAKVFGYIDQGDGATPLSPSYFGLVLPAFSEARLIPVQRAVQVGGSNVYHDYEDLPDYVDYGISAIDADGNGFNPCNSCQALIWWEDDAFRAEGQAWIADPDNTENCYQPPGGGGGGAAGGAPFGH